MGRPTQLENPGFSLAEVMVGVVLISVVFMMGAKAIRTLASGFHATNSLTRATDLAQAQLGFMKARGYNSLRTTIDSAPIPGLTLTRAYDTVNFPPETVDIGGCTFSRYSYVEKVERAGGTESVTALPPDSAETGLKRITVVVTWSERGNLRSTVVSNVIETANQNFFMLVIRGTVTTPSGVPIPGATVMSSMSDERSWGVTSDTGTYQLKALPGSYTLQALAPGYETVITTCTLTKTNAPLTINFALSPRLRVPLEAVLWYNDHPVISRVAAGVDLAGFNQEYVELFNPTTWTWTVAGQLGLKFQRTQSQDPVALPISIQYLTASVGPRKFYLFANANSITVSGVTRNADAVWAAAGNGAFPYFGVQNNIIPVCTDSSGGSEGVGGIELYRVSNGTTVDRFGWVGGGGQTPGLYETTPFPDPLGLGAEQNEDFRRLSSTSGVSLANGPAYDSGNNSVDWVSSPAGALAPRSSVDSAQPIVAGVPAVGGWFGTNTPYGMAVQAVSKGSPPYASALLSITTAPFTMDAYFNGYSGRDQSQIPTWINPPNQGLLMNTILVFNANPWAATGGTNYTVLAGRIINTAGVPQENIPVGMEGFLTKADGSYSLFKRFDVGTNISLPWVNQYGNINRRYESFQGGFTVITPIVNGKTLASDIILKGVATVTGKIVNEDGSPVAGASVNVSGPARVTIRGDTDAEGIFRIPVKEGTGTLSFNSLALNITPNTHPFVVNPSNIGFDVDTSTFVSKNRLGYLSGTVRENGTPLRTGATIVALNVGYPVLSSTAPAPVPSTSFMMPKFRMTQSLPDGHYRIGFDPAVTGYTCNVYAYRTKLENGVLVTRRTDLLNVVTNPNSETLRDIEW